MVNNGKQWLVVVANTSEQWLRMVDSDDYGLSTAQSAWSSNW